MFQFKNIFQRLPLLAVPAAMVVLLTASPASADPKDDGEGTTFNMTLSAGAATCLANARATVTIRPASGAEIMDVDVQGLPPNTHFNLFVIQVPKAPFGVAWYQGDLQTGKQGRAHQQFAGRFSVETFTVAEGSVPAPVVFANGAFPDAAINPPFNPIQMYHLGIWFDSPTDASAAHCPATVTPFNGEHNAGIQVFNTSSFADDHGPLRDVISSSSSKH